MTDLNLLPYFEAVRLALLENQQALNLADPWNGNHGDHMVAIFDAAVGAMLGRASDDLAGVLESASQALAGLTGNQSAQVYRQGLAAFSRQFRLHGITTEDLIVYLRATIRDKHAAGLSPGDQGQVIKAVALALQEWKATEAAQAQNGVEQRSPKGNPRLEMGFLFDVGISYLQAKQQHADKLSAITETALSVCPLGNVPHRRQSGRLVIQTLLVNILG